MNRQRSTLPSHQRGIAFWHILLLVIIAVSLAVCAKTQTIPYLQRPLSEIKMPGMPRFNFQNNVPPAPVSARSSEIDSFRDNSNNTSNNNAEWLLVGGSTTQVKAPPSDSSYELQYPRNLSSGFYTVQVMSGYHSKNAYALRDALRNDGYSAYIHQETDRQGILFKVRVGHYRNRADAFAMNTKLRLSYPKNIKGSFVVLRQ